MKWKLYLYEILIVQVELQNMPQRVYKIYKVNLHVQETRGILRVTTVQKMFLTIMLIWLQMFIRGTDFY
jgi:hypothetical protein